MTVRPLPISPLIVIPARLAATRLPGKPLADIGGQPMIVHVAARALEARVGPVVVAAAEKMIAAAVERSDIARLVGAPDDAVTVVLTDPNL
ncbi:MAG: cytidylyltransferase domain-containing protein, partial [Candidatus Eiseniibacteriota bacterium]